MKRLTIMLSATLFAAAAQAQVTPTSEVQFEATTGPVTVKSVQPPIPNSDDYQATVAQLDQNGDGVVVRSEVPADHALASEFRLVDTDRNGRITDAELSNWK
ncbi:hypothetical protein [Arenimonas terrae]|uniref:EF-hand domain-containing protein n=1 Tax=Arenimonas terrae TaxID=2546226 RepID=A0A5C4RTX6_9GAMM|nr:hypothetical protein [Arenimonas terrae]TNJ34415.1 hypothetical protein E1B00_01095 [Arenimonas terrae]